MKMGMSYRRVL